MCQECKKGKITNQVIAKGWGYLNPTVPTDAQKTVTDGAWTHRYPGQSTPNESQQVLGIVVDRTALGT